MTVIIECDTSLTPVGRLVPMSKMGWFKDEDGSTWCVDDEHELVIDIHPVETLI